MWCGTCYRLQLCKANNMMKPLDFGLKRGARIKRFECRWGVRSFHWREPPCITIATPRCDWLNCLIEMELQLKERPHLGTSYYNRKNFSSRVNLESFVVRIRYVSSCALKINRLLDVPGVFRSVGSVIVNNLYFFVRARAPPSFARANGVQHRP